MKTARTCFTGNARNENTVTEIKNTSDGLISKFNAAKERIRDLENICWKLPY
jgi:hypothetical protein